MSSKDVKVVSDDFNVCSIKTAILIALQTEVERTQAQEAGSSWQNVPVALVLTILDRERYDLYSFVLTGCHNGEFKCNDYFLAICCRAGR